MLLLRSSAQHLYWLGRYLSRIGYIAVHVPVQDDLQAAHFSQALGLHFKDAKTLNQLLLDPEQERSLTHQLQLVRDNIQELRGLLSASAYAELNHLIKHAASDAFSIQTAVAQCCSILQAEAKDICLFFKIGQCIEQIDTYFRFRHNTHSVIYMTDPIMQQLFDLGWVELQSSWKILKHQPDVNQFYAFTYKLEHQFEACA